MSIWWFHTPVLAWVPMKHSHRLQLRTRTVSFSKSIVSLKTDFLCFVQISKFQWFLLPNPSSSTHMCYPEPLLQTPGKSGSNLTNYDLEPSSHLSHWPRMSVSRSQSWGDLKITAYFRVASGDLAASLPSMAGRGLPPASALLLPGFLDWLMALLLSGLRVARVWQCVVDGAGTSPASVVVGSVGEGVGWRDMFF